MTTTKAPEKFVVGETVGFYTGEHRTSVEVVGVTGEEVIANVFGELVVFVPRADGKYVAEGSRETDVMPDMIFRLTEAPTKVSFWGRVAKRFA